MRAEMVVTSSKEFQIRLYPETTLEKAMVEALSVPGAMNHDTKVDVFKPDVAGTGNPKGDHYLQIVVG